MNLIERPYFLKKISDYKNTVGLIKLITGVRRCGKSTLFKLYQNYLLKNNIEQEQIIDINLDDIRNRDLLDPKVLFDHIESRLLKDKMNYIFLDEIQNVKDFQWVLNTLNNMKNVDLYATGSNSYLLSGEWATLLSGRYIQIKMYTLSFKEYVSYFYKNIKKIAIDKKHDLFESYIKYGGFPYILKLQDKEETTLEYLDSIYNAIVLKDVMQRNKIIDQTRLEKIILFLADNIGSLTSINNIKNQMANDGFSINISSVENYIYSLINSFFVYRVPRYDIKGKGLLKTNDKYYLSDLGFRYYLFQNKQQDTGHILENIVYLELLRRGYKVYIGKLNNIEIDFVAVKGNQKLYIQVCENLLGEKTREREFKPLKMIDDNYKKLVITKEIKLKDNIDGIEYINIIDWLLE